VKGMPMHRISWETERAVMDWAKNHYTYFTARTFDDIIFDLVQAAKLMEKKLEDKE
jgi:hypothetical protein